MKNWYDRGYLQVFDKESGEMLLEIETTLEHVERYSKYNFDKCEYAFIKNDYDYIIDNETLMKMNLILLKVRKNNFMKYSDLLKQANKMNIDIYSLFIAYTLDCILEENLSETRTEEFNRLCSFIENIVLKCDNVDLDEICSTVNRLIFTEQMKIDDLLQMNKWDFLQLCY